MMPQPIGAPDAAATPTNNAPKTPNAAAASASIMQFMERFDQSGIKWKKWLQRLENAMEVGDVSKTIKPKMLLHCIGARAYDELTDLVAPAKPESMQYDELTKILTEHFEPEPLEMMELLAFRNRNQQEGESIKEYTRALLHKANDCGFGDHIQKAVRNQLVFGIRNEKIRLRLLQEKDLTLEKAKEIALSMEAVEEKKSKSCVKASEKFEKKLNFPFSNSYHNTKSSFDRMFDDIISAIQEYYENNKGRKSDFTCEVKENHLYLTLEPVKVEKQDKKK